MAFNSFSVLDDIVDDIPQTVVFNKKAKESVEKQGPELREKHARKLHAKPSYSSPKENKGVVNDEKQYIEGWTVVFNKKAKETPEKQGLEELQEKQAQKLHAKPSYSSPEEKKRYQISIQKRNRYVEKWRRVVNDDKQYMEGWRKWLEVEKELVKSEDESAYFSSRDEEGKKKGLRDEWRLIQEAERWSKEEERLFLDEWRWLVKEERVYVEGWKRWAEEKKMMGVRSWIEERQRQIRGEERMLLEDSWRWIKEEKEFIEENRRWVVEEEHRISMEKESLEREKKAPFASFSKEDQACILKQRRNMVNERKVINVEEKVVVEEEKRIKEEEKRIVAEGKRIMAAEKRIQAEEKRIQAPTLATITKQEKERIVKQALFVHPKISRPSSGQNIPGRNRGTWKDSNSEQGRLEVKEEKKSVVTEPKKEEDEVVGVEDVKDGGELEESKSETSEGKRNKKKKKLQKKIIVKSKEEEHEERRKEAEMMKKMKTLKQYEEDFNKKKAKLEEKMKLVSEIRKVELAEEFKSMKIVGKKKETINGFLCNGMKNNLSNGHK